MATKHCFFYCIQCLNDLNGCLLRGWLPLNELLPVTSDFVIATLSIKQWAFCQLVILTYSLLTIKLETYYFTMPTRLRLILPSYQSFSSCCLHEHCCQNSFFFKFGKLNIWQIKENRPSTGLQNWLFTGLLNCTNWGVLCNKQVCPKFAALGNCG